MKKPSGDIIILHMSSKNQDQMMYTSWYMECNRHNFLSFWSILVLLPLSQPQKLKFSKNEKTNWNNHHFTLVYHNWRSYDLWFLRYEVQQKEFFFFILDHFLLFTLLRTGKIKNSKKWKNTLEILSFCTCVPLMTIIWCIVLEIWSATDIIFCHFKLLTTRKFKILRKLKRHLEILPF